MQSWKRAPVLLRFSWGYEPLAYTYTTRIKNKIVLVVFKTVYNLNHPKTENLISHREHH